MNRLSLFTLLACTFLLFSVPSKAYDVVVTETQIQATLTANMPLKQQGNFISLIIQSADIDLLGDGNRVKIHSNLQITSTIGLQSRGSMIAEGQVRFNDADDSFYIDNPQVLDLNIEGVPDIYRADIVRLAQQTLAPAISGKPIYTLKDDGQEALAKMWLKSMTITPDQAVLEFSPF